MERKLTVYFTSDNHGYLSPINYATGEYADTGLSNCMANYINDGNSLIIDGGDSLQGSPFTYYLHKNNPHAARVIAEVMNCGGFDFYTLGNHDFNYGPAVLQEFIDSLDARCLCANVEGLRGIEKTAVVKLKNGLRVGLTGIVTHYINIWERRENLEGLTITEPIPAAEAALKELREENVDLTVCIYHGGFEADFDTGASLSDTDENQGYRICRELGFDILLTGHQHLALPGRKLFDTYICQTPDKAKQYIKMDVTVENSHVDSNARNQVAAGRVKAVSRLYDAGTQTESNAASLLAPLDQKTAEWLDTPVGHIDTALVPDAPIEMAENGSLIANFFNQVQLEASGADISCTGLANEVKGFNNDITVRDVVATYIYPNTLHTLAVNRAVLRSALERCAEYFTVNDDNSLRVSDVFLKPKVEHYNYDYYAGINVTMDVRKPVGERVVSIMYKGEELSEDKELTLCLNNYRSTGTGGYPCFKACRKVSESATEISELIMDYVVNHGKIELDRTKWLNVIH